MKPILVTGATGRVGFHVVSQLIAEGANVRALTRNPHAAGLPAGVELVRGDLNAPDSIEEALQGVETVFLLWTARPETVEAVVERIAANARRVVFLSAPHQTPHPMFQQPNPLAEMHRRIESAIAAAGLKKIFLRPGMFAANALLWWAPQIRAGNTVRWFYADAETAPIDERDIAAVAVRALLDETHDGGDYVLTGTESLTQRRQVEIIGETLGRRLVFDEMSPAAAREELPYPPHILDMLLNALAAAVGQPAYITNAVAEITGKPPRSFQAWAADNAEKFQPES